MPDAIHSTSIEKFPRSPQARSLVHDESSVNPPFTNQPITPPFPDQKPSSQSFFPPFDASGPYSKCGIDPDSNMENDWNGV